MYITESVIRVNTRCDNEFWKTRSVPRTAETSDFWRRLMEARKAQKLDCNQADVAKDAGVRQSAVTKWKTGKGLPTLDKAIKLAADGKVQVEWLLTGRGKKPTQGTVDPLLDEFLVAWEHLLPDGKRLVVGHAKLTRAMQNPVPDPFPRAPPTKPAISR